MKTRFLRSSLAILLAWVAAIPVFAAATVQTQVDQSEVNAGDLITLTITVQNGGVSKIHLPKSENLPVVGTNTATSMVFDNGAFSSSVIESLHLRAMRSGDFTIPAIDIDMKDGGVLHTQPIKIHVLADATAPTTPPDPTATQPVNVPQQPGFNPYGPVVMPHPNGMTNGVPDAADSSTINVPTDADGHPLKIFMVLTPRSTNAYVGEAIPMRIDFYLRLDVAAQQDSLPTIDGSDFMMNPIARPQEDELSLLNEPYHRETWITAISAPKSGDFPLAMTRDTYWLKPSKNDNTDPFGNFLFSRPNLAHEPIGSNRLTFHVLPLPEEGRPANFSGAIGHLKVTATAEPSSVSVGEPVAIHFTVNGEANFSYVRSPTLANDPAWKSYVPSSKIQYLDQSHTQGIKTFEQAVIPQKNGVLPLPAATFSYFDPTTKQYVTTPVPLPSVTVTGTLASTAPPPVGAEADAAQDPASNPAASAPNRTSLGSLKTNLIPAYREPWFWAVQGSLLSALVLSGIFTFVRRRTGPDAADAARTQQQQSLQAEEDAMGVAARKGDAHAFFLAARHAVQLHLGAQWNVQPEALTLGEIRRRDPQRAEAMEPLFAQTDEVIYSGGATGKLDLAQWERHVRSLLQVQLQPA